MEQSQTEWTDEKHRLYLQSMEATFIKELYKSDNHLAWRSLEETPLEPYSSQKSHINTGSSPCQFKVAIWQKINFSKNDSQLKKANESLLHRGKSWTRYSSRQVGQSPAQQNLSSAVPTAQKRLPAGCLHLHDQAGNNEEVSDQNFIGENIKGEKLSNVCKVAKMKGEFSDASMNDQVVPFGNFDLTDEDGDESVTSERKLQPES